MNIWKDEFPCYESEYDEFKKLEDSNIFVLFDDGKIEKATVDTFFTVEGNEHKEVYFVENICTNSFTYDGCDMVKWCYEEDLIKQAENNNLKNNAE